MPKRKAEVNDIVFEVDSEELESSSEDEKKITKNSNRSSKRLEAVVNRFNKGKKKNKSIEVVDVESSGDEVVELLQTTNEQNGGNEAAKDLQTALSTVNKNFEFKDKVLEILDSDTSSQDNRSQIVEDVAEDLPLPEECSNVVASCENRQPMITVRFKDRRLAKEYKGQIKMFMLNLIKLHDSANLTGLESDTDLELDIWPEDVTTNTIAQAEETFDDDLFFVDTAPNDEENATVPHYKKTSSTLTSVPEVVPPPEVRRAGPSCFNCDGAHAVRDCKKPKNMAKIAENRKAKVVYRVGRYHVEDDQKYGHLIPGRISGQLRYAMDLKRDEIPTYIYRMRMLGYPPGWLEEARISHSGISMFDSKGKEITEADDEEGQVFEPGSKDKFDIKKILDFPGFNVPVSSRYKEQGELYGFPPMSEEDSKMNMLQVLAPNAMMAYKRKKLSLFPSGTPDHSVEGQGEMELVDEEELAVFPTLPPLPDEAPPSAPPPPPPPPESPKSAKGKSIDPEVMVIDDDVDLQDMIVIDECNDTTLDDSIGPDSPSLDDLEQKKQLLMEALTSAEDKPATPTKKNNNELSSKSSGNSTPTKKTVDNIETPISIKSSLTPTNIDKDNIKSSVSLDNSVKPIITTTENVATVQSFESPTTNKNLDKIATPQSLKADNPSTPTNKIIEDIATPQSSKSTDSKGAVKSTSFGTPIINEISPYSTLPSDDKFSKDICDIINFENLPDSTGKYSKICSLLKRVKGEVDRIHDS